MPDIFEEFFESIGENIHDHLDLQRLSPSYRVFYKDKKNDQILSHLDIYSDPQRMSDIFESMET